MTAPMTPDELAAVVERVAKGLSAAQCRALLSEMRDISNPPVYFLCDQDEIGRATIPTRAVLTRKGLLEHGRFGPTMLTELGLAVRTYLHAQIQERKHG